MDRNLQALLGVDFASTTSGQEVIVTEHIGAAQFGSSGGPAVPVSKLFISYSRDDAEKVEPIREGLIASGYDVWVDRFEIRGGQTWWDTIVAAIQRCDAMIVALSPETVQSVPVDTEQKYAKALGKPVLYVMVRPCDYKTLPADVAKNEIVDFSGGEQAATFRLMAALRALTVPRPTSQVILPPPPEPLDPTVFLADQVRSPTLSRDQQFALVGQLHTLLDNPYAAEAAKALLMELRQRGDSLHETVRQIDGMLGTPQEGPPPKNRTVAALLAVFLGFLGIHNFYLGKVSLGLVQAGLTILTAGYGLIVTVPWALVEAIIILSGQAKDKAGRPLV